MNSCPFCGEEIALEARICRHCDRPTLYQIHMEALHERDAHELFKKWSSLTKKDFNWSLLGSYSEAKEKWTRGRFLLAWNLTKKRALELEEQLKPSAVIISQQGAGAISGGVAERSLDVSGQGGTSHAGAWISLIIAISIFSGLWIFRDILVGQREKESTHKIETLSADDGIDIPEFQWPTKIQGSGASAQNAENKWGPESIESLLSATVFVSEKSSLGSGFLISADGMILTNHHVIAEMENPQVLLRNGQRLAATKVQSDAKLDLSLLKISGGPHPYLEIGDANQVYPGQNIITIGNPGGLSFTVTRGIVSYVGRLINDVPFIQTDAAINRGNSGGPMITEDLKVVGINTLTSLKEQGISFALPINLACQSGGMASSIVSCPGFQMAPQNLQSVSAQRLEPSQEIIDHYKKIFADLKSEWKQKDEALKSEIASKTERTAAMKAENPNATEMIASYESEVKALTRERYERQIRYIRHAISIFERQKGEGAFSTMTAQIDQQIEILRSKDRALSDLMAGLN